MDGYAPWVISTNGTKEKIIILRTPTWTRMLGVGSFGHMAVWLGHMMGVIGSHGSVVGSYNGGRWVTWRGLLGHMAVWSGHLTGVVGSRGSVVGSHDGGLRLHQGLGPRVSVEARRVFHPVPAGGGALATVVPPPQTFQTHAPPLPLQLPLDLRTHNPPGAHTLEPLWTCIPTIPQEHTTQSPPGTKTPQLCSQCSVLIYTLIKHFILVFIRPILSTAAVAYPLRGFNPLSVQRCSSAYHCCN